MPAYIRTRSEFAVNSFTAQSQTAPSVSTFSDGGFVIAWGTWDSTQDGDLDSVKAQLFDSAGRKVGPEFLVNTLAAGYQYAPEVKALANDTFVVSWISMTAEGVNSIRAQLFDRDGDPIGGEFQVNPEGAYNPSTPNIAALANGGFVVSWDDQGGEDVKAQIFDASGSRVGTLFTVNTKTDYKQDGGDMTALAGGGFVATWRTTDPAFGAGSDLKAQIFSSTGAKVGVEFLVNSLTANSQSAPTITALSGGGFVVAWQTADTTQDGSNGAVKAQIFSASGAKVGTEFLVNTQTADNQYSPVVTAVPGGGFMVAWTTLNTAQDGSGAAIKAQMFNSTGAKVGGEMLVNTLAQSAQFTPDLATLADGRVIATWTSESGDLSGYSIRAQILGTEPAGPLENSAPTIISNGGAASVSLTVDERAYDVTTVVASDDGEPLNLRYSIFGGEDSARFWIDSVTGALYFRTETDHEAPVDQDGDNVYIVKVAATDGSLSDYQTLEIYVRHLNRVDIMSDGGQSWTEIWIGENRTAVTTVQAVDEDGLPLTYAIAGGDDSAFFTIDPQTGKLSFAVAPDYEWPQDMYQDNVYDVLVSASDGTITDWQYIAVYVEDVYETDGFAIISDGGEDQAEILAPENQTAVTVVTVQNAVGEVTYEIVGGVDASWFTIDPLTGELSFNQARDFEEGERYTPWVGYPDPNGHDNSFEILVRASDGQSVDEQHLTILVENVDEAPVFYSPWGSVYQPGEIVGLDIIENGLRVGDILASDPDGQGPSSSRVTFSIGGGADSALFEIDPESGSLKFIGSARPDYEAPGDADGNNIYEVSITAQSGWLSTTQAFEIYVDDQAELITITSNGGDDLAIDLAENTMAVTTVSATGPGQVHYEIAPGEDGGVFTIDPSTGALRFNYSPDFESPYDSNYDNFYELDVIATDGSSYDFQHITVRILPVDEAPSFYDGYGPVVALQATENGSYISDLLAWDPEGTQVFYAIVGGADASRFWVDPVTGRFRFADNFKPDFEAPADSGGNNVYDVTLSATSGGQSRVKAFSVTVTNQNEAPVITSNGGGASASVAINERQTAVTTVVAVDPEASPVTYSIVGGTHSALFAINSATGALRFVTAPDFEAPAAGSNNLYTVVVRASAGGHTTSQTLQVRVNDVDESPVIGSNGGGQTASVTVAENQSGVTTVAATHPDPTAVLVYSIAGGADGSRFAISSSTGVLTFVQAPDFEARADADGNGVYDVVVSVSDGARSDSQTLAVTVSNVNEAPVIAGSQTQYPVVENGTAVATLAASDPDGTAPTWSIAGGADAALFAIDPATGALRFLAAPDFEAPADAGADNVYDVIVSAGDGSLSATRTLAIQVANSNEAPVFAPGGSSLQINEDKTAVATLSAADPEGGAVSFAISGGADAALFAIDPATGALRFIAAPDFEAPADSGGDNVYDVEVSASDGQRSGTKSLSIAVANTSPPVAQGPEFVVNSTYQRTQADSDVTRLADGNFLVVWIDADYNTTAGRFVRGQIFAPDGVKIGGELTLQSDNHVGVEPAVAALPNGGFVVVSLSLGSVVARMYDAAGNATTSRLDVGSGSGLSDPQVAVLADGGFAITWSDKKWTGTDFGSSDVRLRLYDAAGAPIGGERVVNAGTAGEQVDSSIAAFAGGGYVVTWSDTPVRGGATVAKAQIFDSAGARVGSEISVAGADGYHGVVGTTVVTLTNGNFAVAWSQSIPDGPTAYRIQIFTPGGVKVGEQIVAPSHAYGLIVGPALTALSDGGLAVAWAPNNPPYYDGSGKAIYVQAYDSAGQPQGAATRVNGQSNGDQIEPSIAGLSDGRFVVTWADLNGSGADDDEVMARIFAPEGYVPNQRPVIQSPASVEVDEGRTAVTQVSASDPDGPGTVTYSIAGGAHAALFQIDSATGALSFKAAPDYEAPAAGSNNVYAVTVRAGDGELSSFQSLQVAVRNVNEAATITSGATASVGENSTAVTVVTASDADGDQISFAISGGADASLFAIDAATGALSWAAAPDHEEPADSDGDNVYELVVSASDGTVSASQALSVTVEDVFEPVEIVSYGGADSVSLTVDEGYWMVGAVVQAVDEEGFGTFDRVVYSITGGADAALFTIDPDGGALDFIYDGWPDFENPADADGDNVYDVVVTASTSTSSDSQAFAISIANSNEGIFITSDGGDISAEVSIDEGQREVTIVAAEDPDGTPVTYSIVGGPDASRFTIDALTGALSLIDAPDYEAPADSWADNVYQVIVSASDGELSDEQIVHVSIDDVDEPVEILSYGGAATVALTMAENVFEVAVVEARDEDGQPVTYAISGADADAFEIDPNTGALSFRSPNAPDFEDPASVDSDNVYDVTVTASSSTSSATQDFSVTIANVNEAPRILWHGLTSAHEGDPVVMNVVACDADGDVPTYSIVGGADAALFEIDAATGLLTFIEARDYETQFSAAGTNVYSVHVGASDGQAMSWEAFQVRVENVSEPVVILSYGGATTVAMDLIEGSFAVGTVEALDEDGTPVTYRITDGADAARFRIDPITGVLSFAEPNAPNFENPTDSNRDNLYSVVVTASSMDWSKIQVFLVSITNRDEPVSIVSNGGGASASVAKAENGTAVTYVTAGDPDFGPVTYAIAGGADAARFTIDPNTGALAFAAAPDFELPADAGADNAYDVIVSASDGSFTDTQALTVTVGNVDEPVEIVSYGGAAAVALTMAEDIFEVATVEARDEDGQPVTYSISGADVDAFEIDPDTGALSFRWPNAPDFEDPASVDSDNVYDVLVTASSSTSSATQAFSVSITNRNEAPSFNYDSSLTVNEGVRAITTLRGYDRDGDSVTLAIVGGADAALFELDPVTNLLSFIQARDFEAPLSAAGTNVYDVEIEAGDGQLTTRTTLQITIRNVNEAVAITSGGGGDAAAVTVLENGTAVTTIAASDVDGDALTYSITGGADWWLFAIDARTGVLRFVQTQSFENPWDSGKDRVYDVVVSVTDGALTDSQAIAVTVANQIETVTINSGGGGDSASVAVVENGTAVTGVAASAPGGDSITYAIAGGADAARFTINAATGALAFVAAPNFEAPADAGADNVYDVVVSATNGDTVDTQSIAVTVGNLNEQMVITSNGGGDTAALSVNENSNFVTTVVGSDPDGAPVTYSIFSGADSGLFTIDPTTGALSFRSAPNFEAPGDSGGNNVYELVVRASDGYWADYQTIAVTVANLAEPVAITSNGGGAGGTVAVAENGTAVATVTASSPEGGILTYAIAGGADAARFTINASTGALAFIVAPNFEAPADAGANNVYDVIVSASNGSSSDTQALAVTVGNVNEGPVITSSGGGASGAVSVTENGLAVITVASTDPEGNARTYSIVGGADAAQFTINAQTGALQFVTAPDWELPADSNQDNVYAVIVRASDGQLFDEQALSVTVGNAPDGNNVTGTSGSDSISATSLNTALRTSNEEDVVFGRDGHDNIQGMAGDDDLYGEGGNDVLIGGAGADRLTGGLGKDQFTFNAISESSVTARDSILDFSRAQGDKISLSAIDANSGLSNNQAFTFIGTAAFSAAGQLRYETSGGITTISGDVNGDGVADLVIQLSGSIALISSDFIL